MFGYSAPKNKEERSKDVRDIIYERILQFREGVFTSSGWKELMEDQDTHNKYSVRYIDGIKTKAKYVFHSLAVLLDKKSRGPFIDMAT